MSYVIWGRRCRKCKGQFFLEENEDGTYLVCIQCGHTERIVEEELVTVISASETPRKKTLSNA